MLPYCTYPLHSIVVHKLKVFRGEGKCHIDCSSPAVSRCRNSNASETLELPNRNAARTPFNSGTAGSAQSCVDLNNFITSWPCHSAYSRRQRQCVAATAIAATAVQNTGVQGKITVRPIRVRKPISKGIQRSFRQVSVCSAWEELQSIKTRSRKRHNSEKMLCVQHMIRCHAQTQKHESHQERLACPVTGSLLAADQHLSPQSLGDARLGLQCQTERLPTQYLQLRLSRSRNVFQTAPGSLAATCVLLTTYMHGKCERTRIEHLDNSWNVLCSKWDGNRRPRLNHKHGGRVFGNQSTKQLLLNARQYDIDSILRFCLSVNEECMGLAQNRGFDIIVLSRKCRRTSWHWSPVSWHVIIPPMKTTTSASEAADKAASKPGP